MKTGNGDREKLAAGSLDTDVGSLAHRFAASAASVLALVLTLALALALAFAVMLGSLSGAAGAQKAREESTGYEPLQSQTTEKESSEPVTGYIMDGDEEEESTARQDSTSEDTSSKEDGGSVLSENPLSDSSESDSSGETTSTLPDNSPAPSESTYEDIYNESTSPATGLTTSPKTTGPYSYQYPGEESSPPYTPDSGGIGTSALVAIPLVLVGALAGSAYLTGLWRPGRNRS